MSLKNLIMLMTLRLTPRILKIQSIPLMYPLKVPLINFHALRVCLTVIFRRRIPPFRTSIQTKIRVIPPLLAIVEARSTPPTQRTDPCVRSMIPNSIHSISIDARPSDELYNSAFAGSHLLL